MREKTIGYMVQDGVNGAVCHLGRRENTLFFGGKATVFATRTEAQRAIQRTIRHWNRCDQDNGLPVEEHYLGIARLVAPLPRPRYARKAR